MSYTSTRKRIAYILILTLLFLGVFMPVQSEAKSKKSKKPSTTYVAENKLWHFDYLDVPETWNYIDAYKKAHPERTFNKVKVAVIDTGAELTHKDLQANLDKAHCVDVTTTSDNYPRYSKPVANHGTWSSGIIGATSKNKLGGAGIAAGNHNDIIEMMAIKVFRSDATYEGQAGASTTDMIKGLEYAYRNGAQVVNMCCGHAANSQDVLGIIHDDAALERKINELVNNGVVVVCSAGNNCSDIEWYPSDFDSCISVMASQRYTDIDKTGRVPSSSFGPKKDISAPGSEILTTTGVNLFCKTGATSAAVAVVSGVVAMMRYVNPSLTVNEIKKLLYDSATDLYTEGYDIYTGHGLVNAYAAVTAAAGNEQHITATRLKTPVVTAKSDSYASIKLSWPKVPNANEYIIYQYNPYTDNYEIIDNTTATSYVVSDLNFNMEYRYKVLAKGTTSDGKRTESNISGAAITKPTTGPSSLKVSKKKHKVVISWSSAHSATGYYVSMAKKTDGKLKTIKSYVDNKAGSKTIKTTYKKKRYYTIRPFIIAENGSKYYGPETVVVK